MIVVAKLGFEIQVVDVWCLMFGYTYYISLRAHTLRKENASETSTCVSLELALALSLYVHI